VPGAGGEGVVFMARGFAEAGREAFLLRLTYAHPFTARTRAWEGWAFFYAQLIFK
jgi:hypothetical protein